MSKSDFPALRMIVEGGRLVPAGQFDAERLASYRRGAIVQCRFTEEKDRVLVKKWFAIIDLVLKTCDTPWKNKDEAHEAIKLALGIVNLSKTISGQFMQYPKSLTELDDPEMTDALEAMTELLSRMTGVDVETLRKETDHIREYDNTNSGSPPPEADDAPSTSSAEPEVSPASGSSISPLNKAELIECCRKLLEIPAIKDLTPQAKRAVLEASKDGWKETLGQHLHDHLKAFFVSADAQIKADPKVYPTLRASAFQHFAEGLNCSLADIGGEANG